MGVRESERLSCFERVECFQHMTVTLRNLTKGSPEAVFHLLWAEPIHLESYVTMCTCPGPGPGGRFTNKDFHRDEARMGARRKHSHLTGAFARVEMAMAIQTAVTP